ncbi:MAG: NAD(P)/FAD-dependent oxidoreductase [Acidobacteria bacterium]|nr:MAG: NAD(P)/FAD-dependent oxidoreductase [Acidobacteriota bacterium]
MEATVAAGETTEELVEHVDVLIVGAGISGISAACHLRELCPSKSFAILEARDAIGGTWDLFRYPGIRSDSDMFTLGFSFRPWEEQEAIAPGPKILDYLEATAAEHDIRDEIRFDHRVVRAAWASEDALWHVEAVRGGPDGVAGARRFTCRWLSGCTGYFRYDEGYTPELPGIDRFGGEVVHPQHWPGDLDHEGKRVVVIGSGATAVTLIPALSERAAKVTMLQRSPTYLIALPGEDRIAVALRRRLPARLAYALTRAKNIALQMLSYRFSRRFPKLTRRLLRRGVSDNLPPGYDVDTHFNPSYDPWDQRLCLDPDGDLFRAISSGRAEVVTDRIESFTEAGIRLESGAELEADIVVTATGLQLLFLGGIELEVDGRPIDPAAAVTYKAMMLCGVPNLSFSVGYTNASWTLKCDLVARYVCRLLNHMDAGGYAYCTPRPPGPGVELSPVIDLDAGYVRRAVDRLPRQGARAPWRLRQNYPYDVAMLRWGSIDDGVDFAVAPRPAPPGAARPTPPLPA